VNNSVVLNVVTFSGVLSVERTSTLYNAEIAAVIPNSRVIIQITNVSCFT